MAAAPTLEGWDPKRSWDGARHPPSMCCLLTREERKPCVPARKSFASENKSLQFKSSSGSHKSNRQTPVRQNLLKKGLGREMEQLPEGPAAAPAVSVACRHGRQGDNAVCQGLLPKRDVRF